MHSAHSADNAARRRWLGRALAFLAVGSAWARVARAQGYPARPVKLVVPFAPGGGNDLFARQIANKMSETLQQQVVVDNRPGAGGVVGSDAVAKAAPDGYTLLLGHTGTLAINPALYPKLPYDAQQAFVTVGAVAATPLVLVVPAASTLRSVAEIAARAKAGGRPLSFASSGNGTGGHLAGELLKQMLGIGMQHVPYRGTAPALTDTLSGQVDLMFSVIPPALPHIEAGKLRALATTGVVRSLRLPEVPTVAESGVPGYESSLAYGVLAPRGTPAPALQALREALAKALQSSAVKDAFRIEGAEVLALRPEQFDAQMRRESEKWGRLIQSAGVKPD